jgi:uncharacterized RDD family membrane protein YckC
MIIMLFSGSAKRLGDYLSGTIVVVENKNNQEDIYKRTDDI